MPATTTRCHFLAVVYDDVFYSMINQTKAYIRIFCVRVCVHTDSRTCQPRPVFRLISLAVRPCRARRLCVYTYSNIGRKQKDKRAMIQCRSPSKSKSEGRRADISTEHKPKTQKPKYR